MQTGVVKSSWFALAPGHRMDAAYWLKLTKDVMPKLDINPETAATADVQRAMDCLATQAVADQQAARDKRAAAAVLVQEARLLEIGALGFGR